LARALRPDKLTLAALEATLRGPTTPTWLALDADAEILQQRSERLAGALAAAGVEVAVVASPGAVGGGGAPGLLLPGWAVAVPEAYAEPLRRSSTAVVGRLERGRCLLDLRCVPPEDDTVIAASVTAVRATLQGQSADGRTNSGVAALRGGTS
jgi:L-seryl-tRNA(Ser) seleniumtransferase